MTVLHDGQQRRVTSERQINRIWESENRWSVQLDGLDYTLVAYECVPPGTMPDQVHLLTGSATVVQQYGVGNEPREIIVNYRHEVAA